MGQIAPRPGRTRARLHHGQLGQPAMVLHEEIEAWGSHVSWDFTSVPNDGSPILTNSSGLAWRAPAASPRIDANLGNLEIAEVLLSGA